MFDKKTYKAQFPHHEMPFHNHCNHPDINININNNGDDENNLSPVVIDLINRINNVEHDVRDLSEISGATLELGENEDQAYPGNKGKQNEVSISLINKRLEDKADKDDIPTPGVYYLNSIEYPEVPSISGIYINSEGISKFWNNLNWIDITLDRTNDINLESTHNEIPTAKAVFDEVHNLSSEISQELNNYVKDDEIEDEFETYVNESSSLKNLINELIEKNDTTDDNVYDDLLQDITNFNEQIN